MSEIGILGIVLAFLVFVAVIKALWSWTVPELFPKAVEQGLVTEAISWSTAAKLALIAALVFSG